jgi:acetate kinase
VEQRNEDGRHTWRLSENACNLNPRNAYGVLGRHKALSRVFAELRGASLMERVAAVGHRIVHGGKAFTGPTRLDASTLDALRRLVPLAPLAMLLRSEDARAR